MFICNYDGFISKIIISKNPFQALLLLDESKRRSKVEIKLFYHAVIHSKLKPM